MVERLFDVEKVTGSSPVSPTKIKVKQITEENLNHLTAGGLISKKNIIIGNFLGGLAWGLGTVIGATVVVALLIWILNIINIIPIVGNIVSQITNQVGQSKPVYNLPNK